MHASENQRMKAKERLLLEENLNNEKIGIDRMLSFIEQWEQKYPVNKLKQDTEEFRFELEARRSVVISNLKKL